MKTKATKKVSLAKYSLYAIGLHVLMLAVQFYIIIKNMLPTTAPIYIGPIYLPSFISIIILILLVAAGVLMMIQKRHREAVDELAVLNNYKAGYITKHINMFLVAFIILLVKDFNCILTEDTVGNVLSVLVISMSVTELIHNIVFIVLEKKASQV